jgi:hypothetical protein
MSSSLIQRQMLDTAQSHGCRVIQNSGLGWARLCPDPKYRYLIWLNGPHLPILVEAPFDYVSGILTAALRSWFSGQPFVQATDWKEQSIQSISPLKVCEAVTLIGMVSSLKRSGRYCTGATYRGCCHGNVYTKLNSMV